MWVLELEFLFLSLSLSLSFFFLFPQKWPPQSDKRSDYLLLCRRDSSHTAAPSIYSRGYPPRYRLLYAHKSAYVCSLSREQRSPPTSWNTRHAGRQDKRKILDTWFIGHRFFFFSLEKNSPSFLSFQILEIFFLEEMYSRNFNTSFFEFHSFRSPSFNIFFSRI